MSSWLDKLLEGHKKKPQNDINEISELYKKKLKTLVYDDELVEELLPVFTKLHGSEGFERICELIEAKEQQIAAISGGNLFDLVNKDPQDIELNEKTDDGDNKVETSAEILAKKYNIK